MSILDSAFRTVTCDGCNKTITFQQQDQEAMKKAVEDNPWLKTLRIVQTSQGRNFAYCSDECELKSVSEGKHNPEEPKRVIAAPSASAMAQAAAAAKQAEEATRNIKSGQPVTLHTV